MKADGRLLQLKLGWASRRRMVLTRAEVAGKNGWMGSGFSLGCGGGVIIYLFEDDIS